MNVFNALPVKSLNLLSPLYSDLMAVAKVSSTDIVIVLPNDLAILTASARLDEVSLVKATALLTEVVKASPTEEITVTPHDLTTLAVRVNPVVVALV